MLDVSVLRRIRLNRAPTSHRMLSYLVRANYTLSGLNTVVEGLEHLRGGSPAILAMNHTDRFNYMPFQVYLIQKGGFPFTATWVKGKYFENPMSAQLLVATNNLPVPSRGYLAVKDFAHTVGRLPSERDYGAMREWRSRLETAEPPAVEQSGLRLLWERPRNVLGLYFDPQYELYPVFMERLFEEMMAIFTDLNRQALLECGLHVLVFPQGTRTVRLSEGHTGLSEMAMHLKVPIIPIGCNGSDRVYPGDIPWAGKGKVTYRVGPPLTWDGDLAPTLVSEPFSPFTRSAARAHGTQFAAATRLVMDRINDLLDPPYRYGNRPDDGPDHSINRFV